MRYESLQEVFNIYVKLGSIFKIDAWSHMLNLQKLEYKAQRNESH